MTGEWHRRGLTAVACVVVLLLGAFVASAQDAAPSLGEKYKQAEQLYDQGDYAGAKQLLLEVKEGAEAQKLPLNRATKDQIDRRLAEIDAKLGESKPAPTVETPKVPETPKPDPEQLTRINAAKVKYAKAQNQMRARNYDLALFLLNEVKSDIKGLPVAPADRAALDASIADCEGAQAAVKAAEAKAAADARAAAEARAAAAAARDADARAADEARRVAQARAAAEARRDTEAVMVAQAPDVVEPTVTTEPPKRYADLEDDPATMRKTAVTEPEFRGGDTSVFRDAVVQDSVRIQLQEQEIRTKLADGIVFLREHDYRRAEGKFLAAQLQVKYGEFPAAFKQKWLAEIQKYLDLNAKARADYDKRRKEKQVLDANKELDKHLQGVVMRQRLIKAKLMEQWQTYYEREQYDDALLVLERARELDPEDKSIPAKLKQTMHKKYETWRHKLIDRRAQEREAQFTGIIEQTIPYYPVSVYPDNWRELSDRRLRRMHKTQAQEKPGDRKVKQQLEETVVSFTFNDQPVKAALEFLQTLGNVNIVLDQSKLDETQNVTLKLQNVPLQTAIRLLTEQLSLKYVVRDGIVFISDEEGIKTDPITDTYDVRDLLAEIPNFTGPTFELADLSSESSSDGGSSSGGLFDDDDEDDDDGDSDGATMEESLNDLIELVQQVIAPGSWDEGSGYAIRGRAAQGSIIVTHTPDTQKKVGDLLEALRKTRALQVSIDIRFITLTDTFLEAMGLDWTGAGNPAAAAPHYIDTDADGIPDTSTGIEYDRTLGGANWSLFGNAVNAIGLGTDLGGTAATGGAGGLSLMASFLDDVEVNLVLSAVQQSSRATLLNAPKLTMMNGQRAYIAVSRQINFVRDITVQVSEGAVGYDPDIGTVQDGIVFDVRPTVSADRRYVQMDLRPSLAVVEDITEFQTITAGVFGGAVVQLPEISVTVVRTTVNVPDGGTLLIGGLSYSFDNELESGVPVLSKIPILGKLFSRRGFTTEKRNVVILVKPTIIIQEEEEDRVR